MCILFNEKGTGSRGLFLLCLSFLFPSVNLFIVPVNNAALLVKSGFFFLYLQWFQEQCIYLALLHIIHIINI